ncbi:MAG: hypothetical protein GWP04_02970 [Gammaproteobacteria bacterium]|nr:hypothetical protein [Gammaproteobacteria bacterium]
MSDRPVFDAIRRRRVTRNFDERPVARDALTDLLEAARWAPGGGNSRLHKFVVIDDADTLDLIRLVSPGMEERPPALIAVCTDLEVCERQGVDLELDSVAIIDVGTATMNMMLAAQELSLGTCPTTSFSRSGVAAALRLPEHLRPELLLQVGRRGEVPRRRRPGTRINIDDLAHWGAYQSDRSGRDAPSKRDSHRSD